MSQLTQIIRRFSHAVWGPPAITRPRFAKWNRAAARPPASSGPRKVISAGDVSIDYFRQAPTFADRIEQLYQAFQLAPAQGYVVEFGVFRGGSANLMAQWSSHRADPRVFGFDSFEGLPEQWIRTKSGGRYEAGHFALKGLPAVLDNVELVPGFFDATLGPWLADHAGPVALLHNDSDLYSSTRCTLQMLNDRIVPGTVIVFDELCDWSNSGKYNNWEAGEWRALLEWMAEFDRQLEIISRDRGMAAATVVMK